jgi:hypothetical protein
MDYFEVAVKVAKGFCSLEDLDSEDRRRVLELQKMAKAGKKKRWRRGEERKSGGYGSGGRGVYREWESI